MPLQRLRKRRRLILAGLCLLVAVLELPAQSPFTWQSIDTGLRFVQWQASRKSIVGDNLITAVQVDPEYFSIEIASAAEQDAVGLTAEAWARKKGYTLVVNAGMFKLDGRSNVGFMRIDDHINNPDFSKSNAFFVSGARAEGLPGAQVIDRTCTDWEALLPKYRYVTQSIRMIDCKRNNQWAMQDRIWSTVLVANDNTGKVLFIFCRSPFAVHDLIDMLLASNLQIGNAMYLEGGPEASLFLQTHDCRLDLFGSYETGFFERDDNDRAWPIPNVIGIRRKKP